MKTMEKSYTVYRIDTDTSDEIRTTEVLIEYGNYTQEIEALRAIDELLRNDDVMDNLFTILPIYQLKNND